VFSKDKKEVTLGKKYFVIAILKEKEI